jgi:hypothetical protein
MSDFNTHVNPHSDIFSPLYRPPPGVTKGRTRTGDSIIFGLLITYEVARKWLEDRFELNLASDHSEDINIPYQLNKLVLDNGIAFGCCTAPRRLDSLVSDILVITQIDPRGPFVHDGPDAYDEVLQEDRKPIPGVKEEEVKTWLMKETGT